MCARVQVFKYFPIFAEKYRGLVYSALFIN